MKENENTNIVSNLPEVNQRVKDLVLEKCSGNATEFARQISILLRNRTSDKEFISQQSIDRLFKIDGRSNKYPNPSNKILECIIETYNVSKKWLILGELPKYNDLVEQDVESVKTAIKNKSHDEQMKLLFEEIKGLRKQLEDQNKASELRANEIIGVIGKERAAIMDVLQKVLKTEKKENS